MITKGASYQFRYLEYRDSLEWLQCAGEHDSQEWETISIVNTTIGDWSRLTVYQRRALPAKKRGAK